jgi:hypothetical protein
MRRIMRGCLTFAAFVAGSIFLAYLILKENVDLNGGATTSLIVFNVFLVIGIGIVAHRYFSTDPNLKSIFRPKKPNQKPKSRFTFTKDGEIIEIVEDEKRKR